MTDQLPAADTPPWTGRDIAFALFFIYGFWGALSFQVLQSTGLAERLYGPEVTALTHPRDTQADPAKNDDQALRLLKIRLSLWSTALAFPFQVMTIPVVFYALSGVRPGRIGLTRRRFGRNVLVGVGGWILITPLVFVVHWLALILTNQFGTNAVREHPLTLLARGHPTTVEWILLVTSASIAAPILEEIIFRGALQPWFAGIPNGGAFAMSAAFLVTVWMQATPLSTALHAGGSELLIAALPVIFVVAMMPFYILVARHPPRPESPALFATAVLFAAVHSNVWPSPVPLFVLGLALGTLAARTGSLVGPIVLHGLFNSVTCVMLLKGWG
jgi:membrane protease YdiL (CAAX protease family)